MRGSGRPFSRLWWLAHYAEKNGAYEQTRSAYRAWIGCVRYPWSGYQALARLVETTGTTHELRELVREMLKRWPHETALRNDLAYLSLLLSEEIEKSRDIAADLVAQNPDNLPHCTTLALALLRLRDLAGALQVYAGRQYDWNQALPGNRAVYAAVLANNGQLTEARAHARALPRARLRPEELALLPQ